MLSRNHFLLINAYEKLIINVKFCRGARGWGGGVGVCVTTSFFQAVSSFQFIFFTSYLVYRQYVCSLRYTVF
jgi:hypothetical protein